MADIQELILRADTKGLKQGEVALGQFANTSEKTARSVDVNNSRMGKSFGDFAKIGLIGLASAATATSLSLVALGKATLNNADEMSKASQRFGIGVEELSRLTYAAGLSGMTMETVGANINKLNRAMLETSQGVGQAKDAFARLGVAVVSSDGSLRSSTDVIADLAGKFAAMPDGVEKSALAMDIFGRSGAAMIPLLNMGKIELAKLLAEADALGIVITEKTAKGAEAFNDNMSRLSTTLSAVGISIASDLLPQMVSLSQWALDNHGKIRELGVAVAEFSINSIGTGVRFLRDYGQTIVAVGGGFIAYKAALLATTAAQSAFGLVSVAARSQLALFAATTVSTYASVGRLAGAQVALTGAATGATAAARMLTAALIANPVTAIAVAVGALTAAFIGLGNAQRSAKNDTDNLLNSLRMVANVQNKTPRSAFDNARSRAVKRANKITSDLEDIARRIQSIRDVDSSRGYAVQLREQLQNRRSELLNERLKIRAALIKADADFAKGEKATVGLASASNVASSKLDGVATSAASAGSAMRGAAGDASALSSILDRLFPEEAKTRRYNKELQQITTGIKDIAERERAINALKAERIKDIKIAGADEEDKISKREIDASQLRSILDRLFPEEAKTRRYNKELQQITTGIKDIAERKKAINALNDELRELMGMTDKASASVSDSFSAMADRSIQAFDRLANAIRGGGILDILSSVVNVGLQLASFGVFGKSVQAKMNAPIPSADGGGFTGGGSRSGGLDGKGGFIAMLHPQETVIDHARGQFVAPSQQVVVINNSQFADAYVDNKIMAAAPAIAQSGAQLAIQAQERSVARRVPGR